MWHLRAFGGTSRSASERVAVSTRLTASSSIGGIFSNGCMSRRENKKGYGIVRLHGLFFTLAYLRNVFSKPNGHLLLCEGEKEAMTHSTRRYSSEPQLEDSAAR